MNQSDSLTAKQENPLAQTGWNARLRSYPHSNIFHTAEWADVLHQTYGFTPCYQTVSREDETLAIVPVMEVNSWLTGRRGVSLPFTDECEPLLTSEGALSVAIKAAVAQGRANRWNYFETRGDSTLAAQMGGGSPSMSFFTHHLCLDKGLDNLFEAFEGSVRRAIRKAERAGVEIEFSTDAKAMRAYYSLHCQTRREHGLPPQPFHFFQNIQKLILSKNMGTITSAKHNGRTIASAIFFLFGREAIYKFGASDPAFLGLRANNLVMWEAIRWVVQKGARALNFGRTSLSNEGLRRFKLGWSAEENQLNYFKYDLRKDSFVKDSDATEGFHTIVVQNLPSFASRCAGAILYKHVA